MDGKVAVPAVQVVMYCSASGEIQSKTKLRWDFDGILTVTAAQACRNNGDLGLALVWWPEGALLVVEVLGTMEDHGVLCWESDGRHCWWIIGMKVGRGVDEDGGEDIQVEFISVELESREERVLNWTAAGGNGPDRMAVNG